MVVPDTSTACEVFEICDPLDGDKIFVDGKHNANIVREGYRWLMRLMPTAMAFQLAGYPEHAKGGLARIKPFQSFWSGGYLALDAVLKTHEAMTFPPGPTTLLNEIEARHLIKNFDLMSTCNFGMNECRAIRPVNELRQVYAFESLND